MPIINVQQRKRTEQEKRELVKGIIQVFVDVLNVPQEDVQVWIQEFSPESYSKGGTLMSDK